MNALVVDSAVAVAGKTCVEWVGFVGSMSVFLDVLAGSLEFAALSNGKAIKWLQKAL